EPALWRARLLSASVGGAAGGRIRHAAQAARADRGRGRRLVPGGAEAARRHRLARAAVVPDAGRDARARFFPQRRDHAQPARRHDGPRARSRRPALSRQGRHHVGAGVPRLLSGLARARGAARSRDHVRLLAPRDRGGGMTILILGATSAIAQGYARRRAAGGASFILAGRREQRLAAIAADLAACGAPAADIFVADLAVIEEI